MRYGRLGLVTGAVGAALVLSSCGGSSAKPAPKQQVRTVTRTVPAASSGNNALSALVAKVRSSIIRIQAEDCDGNADLGTGFVIGPRLVATVDHVVAGASSITLTQGGHRMGTGTVIGDDPVRDVALIQTTAPLHGAVLSLASRPPGLGEPVAALGFPLGLPLTVTQGTVSGLGRTIPIGGVDRRDMLQTDAPVNPGNSGGPLLDVNTDKVVGLIDLGFTQAHGLAMAVSAQTAGPLLQAWRSAPQPMQAAGCSQPGTLPEQEAQAPPPATTAKPAVKTYTGQAFSILYPATWSIEDAERQESWGTDTTFVSPSDPNMLLRVDVSPDTTGSDPEKAAQSVIADLEQQPDYQQLAMAPTTFDGFAAIAWKFRVRQGGELVQTEDLFFIDTSANEGVGVVTTAPADEYSQVAQAFAVLRASLAMN